MRNLLLSLILIFVSVGTIEAQWLPDSLLHGFSYRIVPQPDDYQGSVVSTVIRKDTVMTSRKGVLYVHGFNDYFFQEAMADSIAAHGWKFMAVDLRRYGRSLRAGDKRFDVRSLSSYYQDIDSGVVALQNTGVDTVVIVGHSTGGLITSMYMNEVHPQVVKGLILNSPFLDWNMSGFVEKIAIPVVTWLGKFFPNIKISQGKSTYYGESLLNTAKGEWAFDTSKKLLQSPPVTAGWIRAITMGQRYLHKHSDIKVSILLMHSSRTINGRDRGDGDAVLDVNDIAKWGMRLGPNVTEVTVDGAFHDMVLSPRVVRDEVYHDMFEWLDKIFESSPQSTVNQTSSCGTQSSL